MTRNNNRKNYDLLIKKTRLALERAKLDVLQNKLPGQAQIFDPQKTRPRSKQQREDAIERIATKIFERRKQRAKDMADKLLLPGFLVGDAEK